LTGKCGVEREGNRIGKGQLRYMLRGNHKAIGAHRSVKVVRQECRKTIAEPASNIMFANSQ